MAMLDSLADKAAGALTRSRADLVRAKNAQSAHVLKEPVGDDVSADPIYIWKREQIDHDLRVQSALDAVAIAEKAAERLKAEAAAREVEAKYRADEKAAATDTKLAHAVDAWQKKGVSLLAELNASLARTANANADRGPRPYIPDAEERVRRSPEKTLPAVFREETVWLDAAGNTPSQFKLWQNEFVPDGHGDYRRVARQVEELPQRWVPPIMPARWADTIKPFDIAGNPIWPLNGYARGLGE